MYSRQALELYGELLKTAGSAVSKEFEKTALLERLRGLARRGAASGLQVPANLGARPAVSSGSQNLVERMMQASSPAPAAAAAAAPKQPGLLANLFRKRPQPAAPAAAAAAPPMNLGAFPEAPTYQQGIDVGKGLATPHPSPPSHRGMLLGGVGLGLGGVGGYLGGTSAQAARDKTQRNLAFGAGAASGLIAPSVLRGIADTAQSVALSPSNLIPGRY